MLTAEMLRRMWPHGDSKIPGLIDGIVAAVPAILAKYRFDSPLAFAHLMAELSHECGAGTAPEESLFYTTPGRIASVWPTRFTAITAVPYVRNPRKLANAVYNGRMGNVIGSDDGFNFRGRGGPQLTGRNEYTRVGEKVLLDLLAHPELANDPKHFFEISVACFMLCGCYPFALRDDVRGVCLHLNGGYIGLDQRREWLRRWKIALAAEHGPDKLTPPARDPNVLQYGDKSWQVGSVQRRLAELGYSVGTIDDDFGASTRTQVLAFQADRGLPTTGIVDQATESALAQEIPKPVSEDRQSATVDDLRGAGSTTIAHADSVTTIGKMKIAGGSLLAGGGALSTQTDQVLDKAQDAADKIGRVHSIWDSVSYYAAPLLAHGGMILCGVAIVALGFASCWFASQIRNSRLQSHQTGENMGR